MVSLLEARACPDCKAQSHARATYSAGPVRCPSCRYRRALIRSRKSPAGTFYCAPCEVEVTLGGRRQHEMSGMHQVHQTISLGALA